MDLLLPQGFTKRRIQKFSVNLTRILAFVNFNCEFEGFKKQVGFHPGFLKHVQRPNVEPLPAESVSRDQILRVDLKPIRGANS